MGWRQIHRWLGLVAGVAALVLGITGAVLAVDPVQTAWQAEWAPNTLPVAVLAERVQASVPGAEEIRHQPAGDIVVYGFDAGQATASHVSPADGSVLHAYQPSPLMRWFKNLHRSFMLGDGGRIAAAGVALSMLLLSVSGLVLMARRQGGWRNLFGCVRGTLLQRIHAVAGQLAVLVLCVSSVTALYMSAATFGLITVDNDLGPDVVSVVPADVAEPVDLPVVQLPLLQQMPVGELVRLNLPDPADPEDTWQVTTAAGQGWIDRYSGETLLWQNATLVQRIHGWVMMLHTGDGLWPWALALGLAAASIPLFWFTGLLLWWQGRQRVPRIAANSAPTQADSLIFVASENGSTWGFAEALHAALVRAGHTVHSAPLEQFRVGAAARQVFVFAATYGDGQAPAHAARALERIAQQIPTTAPVTVLGFGDRQFPAFCAYASAVDATLRERGWTTLLPLERIHQQSAQEFARWGQALAQTMGEELTLDYRPRLPPTTALTLLSRQDHPGGAGDPATILRFAWPAGRGLRRFAAGDLLAVLAPGSAVPRFYSLASAYADGFVEICVRKMPGGLCSNHLHSLQPGDSVQAFVRANPAFALESSRRPVMLIGAGTGVAPLAGFIRSNTQHAPMHLYFGGRDPALDYYFGAEIEQWLADRRLASLHTTFSRVADGGGYVQDALRRDAERLRELFAAGAVVRVCGSRPMAQGVAKVLDDILQSAALSVQQLKSGGRYAEDIF